MMMENKIAVITGSNRGIGKETALELAKKGYTVIMACRNILHAEETSEWIKKISNNQRVYVLKLDLSNSKSIIDFVQNFKKEFRKVNILINNAGINIKDKKINSEGNDLVIATNYLGPYLLTKLMIPLFINDEESRIINLTSGIYKYGKFKFSKLNNYKWVKSYAVSKYLIMLYTFELAHILKETGITVNTVHPGIVRTEIMYTKKWYDIIIKFILKPFFIYPDAGAQTIVYLASSNEIKNITGEYFYKCRMKKVPNRYKHNKLRSELINMTNRILDLN